MPTPDYTALEKSIGGASFNIGRTNREVRDKIEALDKTINTTSDELAKKLEALTTSITTASRSSTRLATAMIWLTVILALAAAISASVAVLQWKYNSQAGRRD